MTATATVLRTTAPLSADQARELTDRIRATGETFVSLLYEAHERRAWDALGYASWREYATEELNISQSRAYELLDVGRVVAAIEDAGGQISDASEISSRDARHLKAHLPEVAGEIQERVAAGEEPEIVTREVLEEKRGERRAADRPAPPADDQEEGEEEQDAPDLVAELEHAHAEIRRLEALNDSLSASDLGAEVKKLSEKYARLEGRLQQEITTRGEAQQQAQRQTKLLKDIRTALQVQRDAEILPAIKGLYTG